MGAGKALCDPKSGPVEGESMTTDGVEEEVVPAEVPEADETPSMAPENVEFEGEENGNWEKRSKYTNDRDDGEYDKGKRRKRGVGDAVVCRPLEVVVRDDRVEQAIRQLKNRMAREGVLRELKNRRHYFKPSELKRIKSREAARRRRKQARQKNGQ